MDKSGNQAHAFYFPRREIAIARTAGTFHVNMAPLILPPVHVPRLQ
jgi:hypothetical protein